MHLLLADGAVLDPPRTLPADAEGARRLAELYAFPTPGTSGVHVRAMMNTTIDGAVAGADGTSGSLRNPEDSFVFGVLRALADVVLVGAQTVREEDYRRPLGRADLLEPSRRPSGASRPALAIWSRSGELPATVEPDWPTFLITPPEHAAAAARRSGLPAAQILPARSVAEALQQLAARGLRAVQAEGGPASLGRLAAAGALDELCFSTTHRTVGGASSRVLHGAGHEQRWELVSLLAGQHATISRYRRA
ncbi:dihydrofolate reductase family protein [Brachybacterium sp. YJGR34]|uniref:dihydrofolate reductase family protein n=1 Tax=Brachybacterium sp. YJGR34 TaxID=2059911 RepID=UPI000E09E6E7|nr:dihydrofolate reductase family protein [Brachybacterium sp. YJGR34]